jgi:hypothetical protein
MLKTISRSSLRPLYLTTDTGIGSIPVVCSHNQVCIHLSLEYHSDAEFKRVQLFIAPRNLRSKEDNEVGEVFFNVGNFTTSKRPL